jgi:hypothetical protein
VTVIRVTRKVKCDEGVRRVSVDTSEQPPALARRIEELLSRLDLIRLERLSPMHGGGGRFDYEVTVSQATEQRQLRVEEGNAGPVLLELLDLLLIGPAA